MICFTIIRIRNDRITIPYLYFKESGLKLLTNIICYHLVELKAYSLEIYHPELINEIEKCRFPFIYKKLSIKKMMISKKYKDIKFNNYKIQYGDGEGIYTY